MTAAGWRRACEPGSTGTSRLISSQPVAVITASSSMRMPVFQKRRFQHGATARPTELFPAEPAAYRRIFERVYEPGAPVRR